MSKCASGHALLIRCNVLIECAAVRSSFVTRHYPTIRILDNSTEVKQARKNGRVKAIVAPCYRERWEGEKKQESSPTAG